MNVTHLITTTLMSFLLSACSSSTSSSMPTSSESTSSSSTPNTPSKDYFSIQENKDAKMASFTKKVLVFDIPILAVAGVPDAKLLHAANVMAQYLDNNEDGIVDNLKVIEAMKTHKAFLVMWSKESDLNSAFDNDGQGQDLGSEETKPTWHANKTGTFDASLEEVWHLITHVGYANAYPEILGESKSKLTEAMDIARGGHFTSVPKSYPKEAWYSYDDTTCDYSCMATEYIYWGMTSLLGAQTNRLPAINNEWKANTKEKMQAQDKALTVLLINPNYKFPTKLPDGKYKVK